MYNIRLGLDTCRHILKSLQQNVVAKVESAYIEQILLLPQCFQLYLTIIILLTLTANLQQITLKMTTKNMENLYNCRYNY